MAADDLLSRTVSACRRAIMGVAVISLFINVLMLTAPLYMMQVFDRVLSSRSTETLFFISLIAVAALMTHGLLEFIRSLAFIRVATWIERQLGGEILSRSIEGALTHGKAPSVQGLRDIGAVRGFLTGPAIFPILDAPWSPIFLFVVFLLHPWLGILALAGAVVLFILALVNEFASRGLLNDAEGVSMRALRRAESAVRNADVIGAMGMLPNIVRRWREDSAAALELQTSASARSGAITAASKFLRLVLQIAVLGLGAYLVIQNELGPGSMIAASILMARALAPVEMAIGSWRTAVGAREAYARIGGLMEGVNTPEAGIELPEPKGLLSAESLLFAYPGAEKPVIKNVSFAVQPGELLGMIGPTASGKSTLASLLVGNLTPRGGHVRLDSMEISQWESSDRGRYVGFLPQDVELFAGTVRDNIARMGEGDSESVIAAATIAGVHDMILRLPAAYDTEIGEGGAALSGGQRQRIALARAIYGGPKIVVLDEPNANLDNDGEVALLEAIAALKAAGTTVVLIAHRPSLLRDVDKVLILEDGAVRMFGLPDEVIPSVTRATTAEAQI